MKKNLRLSYKTMNTKLSLLFTFSILCLCSCELGTDRVYMEMYEAMKANSDAIENGIESKISAKKSWGSICVVQHLHSCLLRQKKKQTMEMQAKRDHEKQELMNSAVIPER